MIFLRFLLVFCLAFASSAFVVDSDTGCDTIILQSGETLSVRIVEISNTEVRYKKCDEPEGATYTIPMNKIDRVSYSNSDKKTTPNDKKAAPNTKRAFWWTVVSFITLAVGLLLLYLGASISVFGPLGGVLLLATLLLSIIALILGVIALIIGMVFAVQAIESFYKNPNEFKNKGLFIATLIILSLIFGLASYGIIPALGWGIYFFARFFDKKNKPKHS